MIPTLLLAGVVIGRFWVVPASAIAWASLLLATGTIAVGDLGAAAGLAAANALVGVVVRKGAAGLVSHGRATRARPR